MFPEGSTSEQRSRKGRQSLRKQAPSASPLDHFTRSLFPCHPPLGAVLAQHRDRSPPRARLTISVDPRNSAPRPGRPSHPSRHQARPPGRPGHPPKAEGAALLTRHLSYGDGLCEGGRGCQVYRGEFEDVSDRFSMLVCRCKGEGEGEGRRQITLKWGDVGRKAR